VATRFVPVIIALTSIGAWVPRAAARVNAWTAGGRAGGPSLSHPL
jgi:hypothetical protein